MSYRKKKKKREYHARIQVWEEKWVTALQYGSFYSTCGCRTQNRYYVFEWWEENGFLSSWHVYVHSIDRCIRERTAGRESSAEQLEDERETWRRRKERKKEKKDEEGEWGEETEWEKTCGRWSIRECRGAVQSTEAGAGPRLFNMQAMPRSYTESHPPPSFVQPSEGKFRIHDEAQH